MAALIFLQKDEMPSAEGIVVCSYDRYKEHAFGEHLYND